MHRPICKIVEIAYFDFSEDKGAVASLQLSLKPFNAQINRTEKNKPVLSLKLKGKFRTF